jgi:hypothetical protein
MRRIDAVDQRLHGARDMGELMLNRGRFVLPSTHEPLCSLNRAQSAWL